MLHNKARYNDDNCSIYIVLWLYETRWFLLEYPHQVSSSYFHSFKLPRDRLVWNRDLYLRLSTSFKCIFHCQGIVHMMTRTRNFLPQTFNVWLIMFLYSKCPEHQFYTTPLPCKISYKLTQISPAIRKIIIHSRVSDFRFCNTSRKNRTLCWKTRVFIDVSIHSIHKELSNMTWDMYLDYLEFEVKALKPLFQLILIS